MTRITWARSVLDWHDLNTGYRFRALPVWPYHALDEGALHPDGGYRTRCGHSLNRSVTRYERPPGPPCPDCAVQLSPRCGNQVQRHRPEACLELLNTAVTRRQVVSRVVELVLAIAQECPTLSADQRDELRALAARVRPGGPAGRRSSRKRCPPTALPPAAPGGRSGPPHPPPMKQRGARTVMATWVRLADRHGEVSHAVAGQDLTAGEDRAGVFATECGRRLPADASVQEAVPERQCPHCLISRLARAAANCDCSQWEEANRLRGILGDLITLATAPLMTPEQRLDGLQMLARRAHDALEGSLTTHLSDLAQRWLRGFQAKAEAVQPTGDAT